MCPAPCEESASRDCTISFGEGNIPDWILRAERRVRFCDASEEVNLTPHGLRDVELLFRIPQYFVGFR